LADPSNRHGAIFSRLSHARPADKTLAHHLARTRNRVPAVSTSGRTRHVGTIAGHHRFYCSNTDPHVRAVSSTYSTTS
jgi:hypothetical protein